MKRRLILIAILITTALGALVASVHPRSVAEADTSSSSASKSAHYHRPTILVHGFKSGPGAFDNFIMHDEATGKAQFALRVIVRPGHLQFEGDWTPDMKHPLIQVVFARNRANWDKNAIWLNQVLRALRYKYHVHTFNAIAHSRGCLDLLIGYAHAQPLKLKRAVLVAGAYDGALWRDDKVGENHLEANGEPVIQHPEYRELTENAKFFPAGVHVLSVMGDKGDGSHSDGVVTNVSTMSLKHVLGGRFASYRVEKFTGALASHHALPRENHQVWKATTDFLWPSSASLGTD